MTAEQTESVIAARPPFLARHANPARFKKLAAWLEPVFWALGGLAAAIGLYLALIASPPDYQQGDTVRIMYVHVPAAMMGMGIYAAMAVAGLVGTVNKHLLADLFIRAAAPVGCFMTALCLITGSLWGKPMWGTYWVWDARLTSMLVLFFLYIGAMLLADAFERPQRGERAAAILVMIGSINLPIIKFSVNWWNTLHQPASLLRTDGPSIDSAMLLPLIAMITCFTCLSGGLILRRLKNALLDKKLSRIKSNNNRGA